MPTDTEKIKDLTVIPTFYISIWYVLLYLGIVNAVGLLVLAWDHRQAKKKNGNRVAEVWLTALGMIGGAAAMWVYMRVTRHKIRYPKFKIGFPIMALLHMAFVVCVLIFDYPHKAIELDLLYIIAGYVLMNLLGIFSARMDKRRAKRNMLRVSESTLMLIALLGGALGMFLAMLLLNHKTRYMKFMAGLPLMAVAHLALFWWMTTDACSVLFIWFP